MHKKKESSLFKRKAKRKDFQEKRLLVRKKKGFQSSFQTGRRSLLGILQKNWRGFAFLVFDNKEREDAFVPFHEARRFFHGDRVEVFFDPKGRVKQIVLIEHRFKEWVGRFYQNPRRGAWVVYERRSFREEIPLSKVDKKLASSLKQGDWVRIRLSFHQGKKGLGQDLAAGEILESYGSVLPAVADLVMIAGEFNLDEGHSGLAIAQAKAFGKKIPDTKDPHRVDLSSIAFITIDGETARDFDDAIFVEKKGGHYILWVGIADVSFYVEEGTELDKEAYRKATSVYFPERAFHMLPGALSEGLCSLKPNEPRLAMVARMEFNASGENLKTQIMEAVILSQRRATYSEIQKEWEDNQNNKDWGLHPHFELFKILKKSRLKRGSIDFELPEAEVVVDGQAEVVSILERQRLDAHRLIEEFMIAANEAVVGWMRARSLPFIYRVHDLPAQKTLEKFKELVATVGIDFSFEDASHPKVFSELLKTLEGHSAQVLLNTALLRSMKQAVYSATHGIHYGLASEGYTHFTSPIRRYPDLAVHRLIRQAIRSEKQERPSPAKILEVEKKLTLLCEHCSYRERLAVEAERESLRLKQVRALLKQVGAVFLGKVTGMSQTGFFVQIKNPFSEGMVLLERMPRDFFVYDERRMVCVGKRTGKVIRMGDALEVQVLQADLERRQVDFGVVGFHKKKKNQNRGSSTNAVD